MARHDRTSGQTLTAHRVELGPLATESSIHIVFHGVLNGAAARSASLLIREKLHETDELKADRPKITIFDASDIQQIAAADAADSLRKFFDLLASSIGRHMVYVACPDGQIGLVITQTAFGAGMRTHAVETPAEAKQRAGDVLALTSAVGV